MTEPTVDALAAVRTTLQEARGFTTYPESFVERLADAGYVVVRAAAHFEGDGCDCFMRGLGEGAHVAKSTRAKALDDAAALVEKLPLYDGQAVTKADAAESMRIRAVVAIDSLRAKP